MEGSQNDKALWLGGVLLDQQRPMKERFRALFLLKSIGTKSALDQILKCLDDPSALLKHECAYCLGQIQDKYAVPKLVSVLQDMNQEPIVRHEAGTVEIYSLNYSTCRACNVCVFLKRVLFLH